MPTAPSDLVCVGCMFTQFGSYHRITICYLSAAHGLAWLHIGHTVLMSAIQHTAHNLNTQLNIQYIKNIDIMRILC